MNRFPVFIPVLSGLLFLMNCQTAKIELPAGFAPYQHSTPFEAVTSDSIQLRVHTTENKPEGSLNVLTTTAQLHFESIGYVILKNEPITTEAGLPGRLFITSVQTMNGEYRYLAAFFLDDTEVHIVEAGGTKKDFEKYESHLIQKIRTLHLSRGLF